MNTYFRFFLFISEQSFHGQGFASGPTLAVIDLKIISLSLTGETEIVSEFADECRWCHAKGL